MDLNYMGVVNVLKAALPGMTARGQGHVVVVSSVMAIIGAPPFPLVLIHAICSSPNRFPPVFFVKAQSWLTPYMRYRTCCP